MKALIEHKGDLHHLFPRDYLNRRGERRSHAAGQPPVAPTGLFAVQEINIAMGNRAPAAYMQTLLAQCEGKSVAYGGITDRGDLIKNLENNANAVPESLPSGRSRVIRGF